MEEGNGGAASGGSDLLNWARYAASGSGGMGGFLFRVQWKFESAEDMNPPAVFAQTIRLLRVPRAGVGPGSVPALGHGVGLGLGLGLGTLALVAAPAQAMLTTVNLTATPSVSNLTSRTFNGGYGVKATFYGPLSALAFPKTVDNTSDGICVAKSGLDLGSCGRRATAPEANGPLTQLSINLAFNKILNLKGFRVGANTMNLLTPPPPAALNFSLNGVQFASFGYSALAAGGTLYKFPGAVWYNPGDVITINNTGINATVPTQTAYLSSLDVEVTPAPLPVLATGAAFAWSRRLRRRLGDVASVAGA